MRRPPHIHLFACAAALLLALSAGAATTHHITSRAEFIAARQGIQPGDTIVFPEGVLTDWGQLFVGESGTAEAPITIRAPYIYGTTLTGHTYFQIQGSHVVLKGFKLIDNVGTYPVWLTTGTHNRVTQCYFRGSSAASSLRASGAGSADPAAGSFHHIDHNFFTETPNGGATILGPDDENHPGGTVVEYNVFRDSPARGRAGEALVPYSLGKHKGRKTNMIIRYNVFDRWDADRNGEIVSVKSGGNHFYRNVFAWNRGYFSLRRENENIVEENLFFNNREGMWIYGDSHTIINNVIDGAERNGLLLPSGWFRASDQIEARAATNNLIAHNTFRNITQRTWSFRVLLNQEVEHPSNNRLVNNILHTEVGVDALVDDNVGFVANNIVDTNLFYTNNGGYGQRGENFLIGEAGLMGEAWQMTLSPNSPAIGAGLPLPGVETDFFRRARSATPDIGHHEFSAGSQAVVDPLMPPVPTSRIGYSSLPLEASFTVFPAVRAVGEPINLDASASKGDIVRYRWDLGDSHTYEGTEHFYPYDWSAPGPKAVRLTVEDATGATHSLTRIVRITGEGDVPGNGWVNTFDWLGWIYAKADPYWWIQSLETWSYVPPESDGWIYLMR